MGQSGPGSNGNEGVTPHSPKLQDWSLNIRWFSVKPRTFVGRFYPSAEMQLTYSTAPVNTAKFYLTHRWDPNRCYHSELEGIVYEGIL